MIKLYQLSKTKALVTFVLSLALASVYILFNMFVNADDRLHHKIAHYIA